MKDKFQILREFANSNEKPDKTIYQFIKEILVTNSAYAKENRQLKDNWNKLKKWLYEDHYLYVPEIAINSTYQVVLNKMLELEEGSDNDVKN